MRWLCTLLLAALAALGAGASNAATEGSSGDDATGDDPLHAADCRSALASLQSQEAAADAAARASAAAGVHGHAAPSAELQAARRLAARTCLASRADPQAPRPRSIQLPVVVAPVAPAVAPRPSPPALAHTPPPVAAPAERPYAVTACDPGGCWANDGSRLNRIGPNLWSKRGICIQQGALLLCP